ncbi:hypothetical protein QLL95_gp1204 [Cotonvirus japonicus]|uniref:Uncharacterized protein n=1 Tax=Cotonvirus japonicus TaxID=2811091 RepID=A0ABM7NRZ2_9VIRU|nr:hypothetical protein QLL95_gp1204 [Cotonvirus japonicus]BCS82919.1 hypothetical protein [Cotonvirus japonicus]
MSNKLEQLIFEQFLEIVEKIADKSADCFDFDKCDFAYRVRNNVGHRLLDVNYVIKDDCNRPRDVMISIDITNICYEDLVTCKWVNYLTKLAKEYVSDICPPKYIIIKEEPRRCRVPPPEWKPFPCKKTTTIIRRIEPIEHEPECEVIIEKGCECLPLCERAPCIPKEEIIIKYEQAPEKCCVRTSLVEDHDHSKHGWATHKGNPDYNNHEWKKCCSSSSQSHGHH